MMYVTAGSRSHTTAYDNVKFELLTNTKQYTQDWDRPEGFAMIVSRSLLRPFVGTPNTSTAVAVRIKQTTYQRLIFTIYNNAVTSEVQCIITMTN